MLLTTPPGTTFRGALADGADGAHLDQLAALSGSPPPDGPVLLAEVRGTPVAAIGIFDRRAVADPGRSTLGVRMQLHLLRLHVRAVASLGWL